MNKRGFLALLLAALLAAGGCGTVPQLLPGQTPPGQPVQTSQADGSASPAALPTAAPGSDAREAFLAGPLPVYDGQAYVAVNGNVPFFDALDLTATSYETYSPLDELGRCGAASASVGQDLMPTQPRGSIREIRPTGWKQAMYDFVDGSALYNRCHLIGWQLTAEDANAENLITGTRYLNVEGMLPFENMVADYVHETGNHVAYRVTPVFAADEPLARGVLLEGESVEDEGESVQFCVYAFNVQPGVDIDYTTGRSWLAADGDAAQEMEIHYVANTNTGKFHLPQCSAAADMNPANRADFNSSRADMMAAGYRPCAACRP